MGHFGGGEILRAVMSASSIKRKPFFYNLIMTGQDGGAGAIKTVNGLLQLKSDAYFLMTSIWGLTSSQDHLPSDFIEIYDAANEHSFANAASFFQSGVGVTRQGHSVYSGLLNDTLASCMTLPEYVLWAPNSLIGIRWMGGNFLDTLQHYKYLVLGGIEYKVAGA